MKQFKKIAILCILLFVGIVMMQSTASAQCCQGIRGNVDGDVSDLIDIADLVYFVSYSFGSPAGPAPPCTEEADVDASGTLDIGDIVYLVAYSFGGGPAPVDCPAAADDDIVYSDAYASGTTYEAFAGSLLDAVQETADSVQAGTSGLEILIPGADPFWSGGAFTDSTERDLSSYNALTFWAKASQAATLDVMGLGNDNTGTSLYTAEMTGVALTTTWTKYVIPFPLASKLTAERGLFYFAEGEGVEYNIWIDEIIFENLGTITNIRPSIPTVTIDIPIGDSALIGNGSVIFDVDGTDQTVSAMPSYFTFASTDPGVASVSGAYVYGNTQGSVTLSADLGATAATGAITVNVTSATPEPMVAAPTPTPDPLDVVSLYSDHYTPATTVDTWSASWDNADVEDFVVSSDTSKKYTNLVFAGIEFTSAPLDASATTHFHMDVWTPDPTDAPAVFKVKLVDFGADGGFGGGDDVEHEITFTESTMNSEEWVSIDIPLSSFTNLTTTGHLAQMIISGDLSTVYIDNIFFYDAGLVTEPPVAAPAPTQDPGDVVSLYSDTYTPATTVDTWSAVWDNADVADFTIGPDSMKHYTSLVFAGIEFTSAPLDASAMDNFRMDVWTPNSTDAPAVFKVKLVDFGADGLFGGGDDVEHELTFDETTMNTGTWVSIDVPLSDFTGLTTTGALAQMIISGDLSTVFIDNIYFYADCPESGGNVGATGGPYSVSFDNSSISYTVTDFGGNVSSLIADPTNSCNTVVQTIKTGTAELWAGTTVGGVSITYPFSTTETQISIRVWSPDAGIPVRVKVEDSGDPTRSVETEAVTTLASSWETLVFDFANEAPGTAALNLTYVYDQLSIFFNFGTTGAAAGEKTYYWDTIEWLYAGGTGSSSPTSPAPTPGYSSVDVISLFSDGYTNVTVDTWSAAWDAADVADTSIAGNATKKYTSVVFAGIEFTSSTIDASTMTHFRLDYWTPDGINVGDVFKIKLVDFGADGLFGGGDDVEHELTFDAATTPAIVAGSWVTFDIPLSDFTNLTTTGNVAQLIFVSDPGPNTIYVDNVLFHK